MRRSPGSRCWRGLARDSAGRSLDLTEIGGDDRPQLVVVRRDLERRVDDQAAAMIRIGDRSRDQLSEEFPDRFFRRMLPLQPLNPLSHRARRVSFQRLGKKGPLVAERVVETRSVDPHLRCEVSHRGRFEAAVPEALDGCIKHLVVVECPGACQLQTPEDGLGGDDVGEHSSHIVMVDTKCRDLRSAPCGQAAARPMSALTLIRPPLALLQPRHQTLPASNCVRATFPTLPIRLRAAGAHRSRQPDRAACDSRDRRLRGQ